MTLVLICPHDHRRELPKVDAELEAAIRRCVNKRVARCDVCREAIVKCEVLS